MMDVRNVPSAARTLVSRLMLFIASLSVSAPPARAQTAPIVVVAFGDSLTAGPGLKTNESFPIQLQMALQGKGHKVDVVNAGVSGDTTSDGLRRFDWVLKPKPDAVIIELGANDALRGIDPKIARANLEKMLSTLKAEGIDVLLTGMLAPENWGAQYVTEFNAIYPDLARKYDVPLYPFFLEGVALDPKFTLPDGLHPTATGVAEIVRRILPDAEALVDRVEKRKAAGN